MSGRRRSLRDFDDDAIGSPDEVPASRVDAELPAVAHGQTLRRRPPAAVASASQDVRTGIYLQADTFAAAKSAYIADFEALPGSPDTFAGWLARVFDRHASQSPAERAALAGAVPAETVGQGVNRSFALPPATIEGMHDAISADRRAGRVTSRSQFASEAIRGATEEARRRAGGVLPPSPDRLPNKMR